MEIICKERQTGKTIKLIGMSAINNIPILVSNERELELIKQKALRSNITIPELILYDESLDLRGKEIYVDNAEWLLQHILHANIQAITISLNPPKEYHKTIDILKKSPLVFIYENWKGEINKRSVLPLSIWYGNTDFHKENQWFLKAIDIEKIVERDFAIKDIIKFL